MTHEQIDRFINDLRTRLINHRHVVVESYHYNKNPEQRYDKIEIELYKDEPTVIPLVTIVWEDGSVSSENWKDITGLTHEGLKPVYKYCPIELGKIVPPSLRNEAYKMFAHNHVNLLSY